MDHLIKDEVFDAKTVSVAASMVLTMKTSQNKRKVSRGAAIHANGIRILPEIAEIINDKYTETNNTLFLPKIHVSNTPVNREVLKVDIKYNHHRTTATTDQPSRWPRVVKEGFYNMTISRWPTKESFRRKGSYDCGCTIPHIPIIGSSKLKCIHSAEEWGKIVTELNQCEDAFEIEAVIWKRKIPNTHIFRYRESPV